MLVDFELIKRAQTGDSAAFNEVVLAYRKRTLGTIARLIGRPEDVEDVGQEVFLRLYFSLDQLRTAEVFEPWLYRLTGKMADAAAGGKRDVEDTRRTKIRETVDDLLGKISEEDRILLTLKEVEGLSLKELEQIYRVNENALKVRLFRARQRVLKAYGETDEK